MKQRVLYILIMSVGLIIGSCGQKASNSGHDHDHGDHSHSHGDNGHDHDHGTSDFKESALEKRMSKTDDDHECDGHDHEEHDHGNHDHGDHGAEIHVHDPEFGVVEISPQEYHEVIHTSGKIMPAQGDEVTLTAVHNGIVVFNDKALLPGRELEMREVLLTISGKELVHDNIETSFLDAKTSYETALANFERAEALNREKITSDKDFAAIKLKFEKAKNNFEIVKRNYMAGGQRVSSSINGFIKNVLVSEGQYVITGQPLLTITKNKRLIVKADVPQAYFPKLKEITTANFKTIYNSEIYHTEELNGKMISYGKTTMDNSLFTPIYFEIDNVGDLLAGSFIEIYLKTSPMANCIVIPKTAILEEASRYFVYVEEGEEFAKRYVTIDGHDGINYHITSGLNPGDHMATLNPYKIKLSTMSSALPAHSHTH